MKKSFLRKRRQRKLAIKVNYFLLLTKNKKLFRNLPKIEKIVETYLKLV